MASLTKGPLRPAGFSDPIDFGLPHEPELVELICVAEAGEYFWSSESVLTCKSEMTQLENAARLVGVSITMRSSYEQDGTLGQIIDPEFIDVDLRDSDDAIGKDRSAPSFPEQFRLVPFVAPTVPAVIHDVLVAVASSGITAAVMQLLKAWVDTRNGRKLKIKIGDIEVEATQMKEADVVRIFGLLQDQADRNKIRELLLMAGKQPLGKLSQKG